MRQDLRYAVRLLLRSRQFAVPAIATRAMGIGLTAAIFSVVDAVLFRPIPFPAADRLVMIWETDRESGTLHEPWPTASLRRRTSATVAASVESERFLVVLLVGFAGFSLSLAAIGIYGVLNYTVGERTREIGIRMALGASSQTVVRIVLSQGARLTILGLAVGLLLGVLFVRALSGLLFGVAAADAGTFASVIMVLAVISGVSTWLPVRRAVNTDPVELFRP